MSRVWDALRLSAYRPEDPEPVPALRIPGLEIPTETVEVRPETKLSAYTDPRGPMADRLRFLRLRLNQVWNAEKLKKLLITSPLPHDGKSTTALNLAVTLTEEGKRSVLLVDGDLHRSTITKDLGLASRPGVAECLESDADPRSLVRRIEPLGFYFLPAGNTRNNPSELLQKAALPAMMDSLTPHFDWIVIDSPPVAPLADALSWKERTDATLLVVRAGITPSQATAEALNLVGRKHVFAIVLNGVVGLDRAYKKYYKVYKTPDFFLRIRPFESPFSPPHLDHGKAVCASPFRRKSRSHSYCRGRSVLPGVPARAIGVRAAIPGSGRRSRYAVGVRADTPPEAGCFDHRIGFEPGALGILPVGAGEVGCRCRRDRRRHCRHHRNSAHTRTSSKRLNSGHEG